jgi:hypothetical protein
MALEKIPYVGEKGVFLKPSEVFAEPGSKVVGLYKSVSEGKFGLDVVLDTADGPVCLTAKSGLRAKIESADLEPGDYVEIEFVKFVPSRFDKPARAFDLSVDRDWAGLPPANKF